MAIRPEAAIFLQGIRKTYGSTVALSDVSLTIPKGRVHALLGENGAGKSTTVKLLSGLVQPDAGTISINGKPRRLSGPVAAHGLGIQTAFQELTLVPDLSVTDNFLLPYQPVNRFGLIRGRHAEELVSAHLREIGVRGISPRAEIRSLDLTQRQKIEIARTLYRRPEILLLDETTSSLPAADVEWLAGLIEMEKLKRTTIVFITHRMPEVRLFCDEMTILRNGATVGSYGLDELSDDEIVETIIGRSLDKTYPTRAPVPKGAVPVLKVSGLKAGKVRDVSLEIAPGEILGIAGLQGMGQLDLFLALFGDRPKSAGEIAVDGQTVRVNSPSDAVRARIGISLVPEERKTEALFLKLDGRRNTTMPVVSEFARFGLVDARREEAAVLGALRHVQADERALHTPVGAFSGGNQQKIVMAKWLLTGSRVLMLFDPTRGVDIGTKHEIYKLIATFASKGGAVLLYSSEIEEVVHLSHRVAVFYDGRIAARMDAARGDLSETEIMRAALGTPQPVSGDQTI